jgi:hypothetical protein
MCHCLSGCADSNKFRTYNMANLRGLTIKRGVNMSPIQVANMAKAARSRPPKTSKRSHRLTTSIISADQYWW